MDIILEMGIVALMGAAATVAGAAEDLETDVGSQSNPNSQVQLAPQMGKPHRLYNKAISGEAPAYGLWCSTAGVTAAVLLGVKASPIVAIALGSLVGAFLLGMFAIPAHLGRIASQKRYNQPIYLDILRTHVFPIMGHGYVAVFATLVLCYILHYMLLHPFTLPLLALIWGITLGAVGSSTGDVFYGAERHFQQHEFGTGLNAAFSGDVVRKAEAGLRSSIDNAWFCSKFGGPVTGLTFGLIVFLDNWRTTVFHPDLGYGWYAVGLGVLIVIVLIMLNFMLEKYARNTYGPYKTLEEVGEVSA
jgi:tetrahydromethanopterin S-methyltransferase subunit E